MEEPKLNLIKWNSKALERKGLNSWMFISYVSFNRDTYNSEQKGIVCEKKSNHKVRNFKKEIDLLWLIYCKVYSYPVI